VTTARQEAEQELAYVVGKDRATALIGAVLAEPGQPADLDPDFPATWAGGHALVIEYGDEEIHGRCQCGERFTPQRPDKPLDSFTIPWERHVMTLGR
jgi:hypothetical protein